MGYNNFVGFFWIIFFLFVQFFYFYFLFFFTVFWFLLFLFYFIGSDGRPYTTKGLVKSSRKKQRLYEKFLKNRNPEEELNYKQYKTLSKSLKKKSKKNYYSDLIDSYKYSIKKRGMLWKKLLETKESLMPLFPILSRWKIEIFNKQEIAETFNSYFCNIGSNLAASIPESKTLFKN